MNPLIEIALTNAFLAGVLALLALAAGRLVRRPALTHALWVLVLLKLITPPLYEMPTGLHLDFSSVLPASGELPQETAAVLPPADVSHDDTAIEASRQATPAEPETELPVASAHVPVKPVVTSSLNEHTLAASTPASTGEPEAVSSVAVMEPVSEFPSTQPFRSIRFTAFLVPVLLFVWAMGAVVWFAVQGLRICRFFRTLRRSQPASEELRQQAQRLALSMGLRRCPEIRILPEPVSPMLWGLGWKTGLLFPAGLLQRLDGESRATLLVHELAHYRRGDHWVRLLELVAGGLYWWHPVVWIARRHLEETEEACCDAWVVSRFADSPRRYAEALLETVDFLSESPERMPGVASGIGDADSIRNRLRSIMLGRVPLKLSRSGRLSILVLGLVLLPLAPGPANSPSENAEASLSVSRERSLPIFESIAESFSTEEIPGILEQLIPHSKLPASQNDGEDEEFPPTPPVPILRIWAEASSPDGGSVIIARTDRSVSFRNWQYGFSMDLSDYEITSAAFSPDGETFATGCLDGKVLLWAVSTGELLNSFSGHTGVVRSVTFSPMDGLLVSAGRDGKVRFWDVNARYLPETLSRRSDTVSPSRPVNCVRFSPDGTLLAVATGDWKSPEPGSVVLWDMNSLTQLKTITGETAAGAISFLPDGKSLIAGGWSGNVAVWDVATGRKSAAGFISKDAISAAAFSPENDVLARVNFLQTVPPENSSPLTGLNRRNSSAYEPVNGVPGEAFDAIPTNSPRRAAAR